MRKSDLKKQMNRHGSDNTIAPPAWVDAKESFHNDQQNTSENEDVSKVSQSMSRLESRRVRQDARKNRQALVAPTKNKRKRRTKKTVSSSTSNISGVNPSPDSLIPTE